MRKNNNHLMATSELYTYRKADLGDLEAVADLWHALSIDQLSKDRYYTDDPSCIPVSKEQFAQALQSDQCAVFLAEKDGTAVAFIEVWLYERDFAFFIDDYAYILHFYVESEDRRTRDIYDICNTLYSLCEQWAKLRGQKSIQADCYYHNERVKKILMQRCDFSEYKTRLVKAL